MITFYLIFYLVFVIAAALLIGWMVFKLKLPSPRLLTGFLLFFVVSPLILSYFYLVYFNSLPEIVVPDVTGMEFENAKEELAELKLKTRLGGSLYELKYPEGVVVSQRPEANRKVKEGRVISLIISAGKRKTVTPNLLNRPLSQAGSILSAAELSVGEVRRERNPDLLDETIIAQEPLPGEETAAGGKVDLLISTTFEVETEQGPGREEEGEGF